MNANQGAPAGPEIRDEERVELVRLSELAAMIVKESGTRAQDFLTLVNAGGVVACLGLISSSSPHAGSSTVRWLLLLYVVGLALNGWGIVRGAYFGQKLARKFRSATDALAQGKGTFAEIAALFAAQPNFKFARTGTIISAASLAAFAVATVWACTWLLTASNVNGAASQPQTLQSVPAITIGSEEGTDPGGS